MKVIISHLRVSLFPISNYKGPDSSMWPGLSHLQSQVQESQCILGQHFYFGFFSTETQRTLYINQIRGHSNFLSRPKIQDGLINNIKTPLKASLVLGSPWGHILFQGRQSLRRLPWTRVVLGNITRLEAISGLENSFTAHQGLGLLLAKFPSNHKSKLPFDVRVIIHLNV